MIAAQRKQSELREAGGRLSAKETLTDAETREQADLAGKLADSEKELREALTAVEAEVDASQRTVGDDPETRERRRLMGETSVGDFAQAAATHGSSKASTGRAAECSAAFGAEGHLPIALLGSTRRSTLEQRVVTPGSTEAPTDAIAPYIFERTVMEFLSPARFARYPAAVLLADADDHPDCRASRQVRRRPATAGAFTLAERRAVRVSGQAEFQIEDASVMAGMEDALRMALTDLLTSQIDESGVSGKSASPDFDGLFDQATNVARPGADEDYGDIITKYAALADGRFSYGMSDQRAAVGSYTYGKLEALYRNTNSDISAYDRLVSKLGGVMVSDRMPAVTNSDSQKGIVVLGAGGGPPRIEVPVWNRMELIRDPYSAAKKGVVTLTAVALIGNPVVRYGTSVLKEVHFRLV